MDYPSIKHELPRKKRDFHVHVFDKLDGSNLHFCWDRRRGWHEFGTRTHVLDTSHPIYGSAWQLLEECRLKDELDAVARLLGCQALTAFAEFWGTGSFAGQHDPSTPKQLTLFDVAVNRGGLIGPDRFLELFGDWQHTPKYLGWRVWDDALVRQVRAGALAGVTFEGVVGKAGKGQGVVMVKAKTQAWVDAVLAKYGEAEGAKIVES